MSHRKRFHRSAVAVLGAMVIFSVGSQDARAGSVFGVDVGDYIILYEGGGGHKLGINNFGTDGIWKGDIGIAGTGKLAATGPGTLDGNINFAAPNTGQASISNTTVNGSVNYGVADVQTKMNNLNTLSTTLSGVNGTDIAINTKSNQTVTTSSGFNFGGNTFFDVTSFDSGNGENLIVKLDAPTGNVVFNINHDTQFHGNILLQDMSGKFFGDSGYAGLSPDQVLFNMYAGASLTGGDTLDANNNGNAAHPANIIYGTFLNPNGKISFVNTRITGRIFGGDTSDMQIVSGDTIKLPTCCNQTPEPPTVALALLGAAAFVITSRNRRRWQGKAVA
jgi:hypothetical protein